MNEPRFSTRLRRLNLNLLLQLDAILRARSLTEAAESLALTQPALSLSLKKLREHFGDELVVYGRAGARPTALASELRTRLNRVLRDVDALFSLQLAFDPGLQARTVTLAAPEALEIMYLPRVAAGVLQQGGRMDVRMLNYREGTVAALFERGVDVAVVPEPMLDVRLARRLLFGHTLTCLVSDAHPHTAHRFSPADYLAARHVAMTEPIEQLVTMGAPLPEVMSQRHIVVRTEHYSALPNVVAGTDLVITTSSWLAQYLAHYHPLRIISPPFEEETTMIYAQWEPHRSTEPFVQWLLQRFDEALLWAGATEGARSDALMGE